MIEVKNSPRELLYKSVFKNANKGVIFDILYIEGSNLPIKADYLGIVIWERDDSQEKPFFDMTRKSNIITIHPIMENDQKNWELSDYSIAIRSKTDYDDINKLILKLRRK